MFQSIFEPLVFCSPFVFPLYLIRFRLLGIPFTVLELYILLLFGLWFCGFLMGQKIHWNKKMRPYFWVAGLLFLGSTLGALFAPKTLLLANGETLNAQQVVWGVWKGWILSPLFYFWVLLQGLKKPEAVDKIMQYFTYAAALLVLFSYGLGLWGNGFTYDLRLRGPFESANYLSLYLAPAFLIGSFFLFRRGKMNLLQRYLTLITWAILAHGLFFTKSYGAFLGIFGSFGLYAMSLLFYKPKLRKKLMIGLATALLIFFALLASQWHTPKFQQTLDFKGRSSSSVRLEIYRTSLALISQSPFLGIGPGLFEANYQINAPKVLDRAPLEWNMPHPHNIFLAFWLNAGLLGFLALILLIVLIHRTFTYPLIALWGVLIHGLVDVPFWKNDLAVIFWLLVAGIIVLQHLNSKKISS